MNQRKIGEFLKQLRKEKGLTQEQLAEHFYVSSRSVSRWETGSNMPDVDMLIELADFYNVDIREIIDGERKSESIDNETKDTLKKVAEYATEESNKRKERLRTLLAGSTCLMLISYLLFGSDNSAEKHRPYCRPHISERKHARLNKGCTGKIEQSAGYKLNK